MSNHQPKNSTANTNGKVSNSPMSAASVRPKLFLAVGTAGVTQLRALYAALLSRFGSMPPHVAMLGLDTTSQPVNGLPFLPTAYFRDMSTSCRQLQTFLRRSCSIQRIAEYMPRQVIDAVIGDGASASPPIARLMLEKALPFLDEQLAALVNSFRAPMLGDMAPIANRHPSLAAEGASLNVAGPIDVFLVGSTTGGTVGILALVRLWLETRLAELGIDANYSLVSTLPAVVGNANHVEVARMRVNSFGRLSELLDDHYGIHTSWHADDRTTFRGQGSSYSCVIIPNEPAGDLMSHHVSVSKLLQSLIWPGLGNSIRQTIVDALSLSNTPGPCGQDKFLTLVGHSQLYASAFRDPAGFAAARIGLAATAGSSGIVAISAEDVLAKHGIVSPTFVASLPRLDRPPAAPAVNESKAAALLAVEKQKRQRQAAIEAARAGLSFADACHRLQEDAFKSGAALDKVALVNGPGAAADLARQFAKQLHIFKNKIQLRLGRPAPTLPENASWAAQFDHVIDQAEHRAHEQVLNGALKCIDPLIEHAGRAAGRYDGLAGTLGALHKEYGIGARQYEPAHAATHAILDRDKLTQLIDEAIPIAVEKARTAAMEATRLGHNDESLHATVRDIVNRHAARFDVAANFEEALRLAGETGAAAIEAAVAAAEPSVRVDPMWDRARHSIRHIFVTLPDAHRLVAAISRSGRKVRCVAPCDPSCVTLVSIDMGVELAALVATNEAVEAYLAHSLPGFPPFSDKRHEPQRDLAIPSEETWCAKIALALLWHQHNSKLELDSFGVWTYEGVVIGSSYSEAATRLAADAGRDPKLPRLEALSAEVRHLLHRDESPIETLLALEESLTQQLQDLKDNSAHAADRKWAFVLSQTRSVARALSQKLRAQQRDVEVLLRARGKGVDTQTHRNGENNNRISPEFHENGRTNGQPK